MPRMGRVPNENRGRNQKPVPVILLAGHAIPTIAPPSALDARFDWNAVNAENIIRSEIGMRMRPIDNYARNDWALGSLSKSLGKGYLRVILNVLNSHR